MYILGINDGHLATAALLKDDQIVFCVSEERFTKIKNQSGTPIQSILHCLDFENINPEDIDLVVISSKILPPTSDNSKKTSLAEIYKVIKKIQIQFIKAETYFRGLRKVNDLVYEFISAVSTPIFMKKRKEKLINLGFKDNQIIFSDHHLTHAYTALYASPFVSEKRDVLVFTCDSEGDKLSATVSTFKKGVLKRISETSFNDSLGNIYGSITLYLGMKNLEHEYKVMGLAPYASTYGIEKIMLLLADLISLDKENLRFKSKINSHVLREGYLEKIFRRTRFDTVSASIQLLTEQILTDWIRYSIKKTGIKTIACSGGVFMNIKANQKIIEMPEVKNAFFMPSGGDESNAIGACFIGYKLLSPKNDPQPINNLYLGPVIKTHELKNTLSKLKNSHFKILKPKNLNRKIANLLASGEIVAVARGRMEWGARALGNRSILADAVNIEVLGLINQMIKSRDFWMPFAPVILDKFKDKYIKNLNNNDARYMILTFDATEKARQDLKAAIHPYDKSLRPQVISKSDNPDYYQILEEFQKITGRGGLLNTSFNLHGEPIAYTPEDSIHILKNSGLKFLVLEDYLIEKVN